jgi:hypothetical protein
MLNGRVQGRHDEVWNGHRDGCPCDGIKAASQLSETLIFVGPVDGTSKGAGTHHRDVVITGPRLGTGPEEPLYI